MFADVARDIFPKLFSIRTEFSGHFLEVMKTVLVSGAESFSFRSRTNRLVLRLMHLSINANLHNISNNNNLNIEQCVGKQHKRFQSKRSF